MSLRSFNRLVLTSSRTNFKHYALFFSTIPQERTIHASDRLNQEILAYETGSRLSNLRNPKYSDSVVSFFKELGFSNTLLEKIEKTVPKVLSSKFDQIIKPKIKTFEKMGLSATQIASVVSAHPWILDRYSDHNIERSVLVLKKILGNKLYDSSVLKNLGCFLKNNLDKTLVPNVKFMKSCGIEEYQILQLFSTSARLLVQKAESFEEFVRRVDEMGVERESKQFVYAIRTVSSMSLESWEQKLDVFRGLGYKEDDILFAFRRFPNVFALSKKKITQKADFLLSSGNYDSSFIVKHPYVFTFSLERRLKPRLRVLKILERKKLLKFKPIVKVFVISDSKFFVNLVRPHLSEVKELSFMVNEATKDKHFI